MIQVGYSVETITPPTPLALSGIGGAERIGASTLDELKIRTVYFQDDETSVVVLVADLLYIGTALSERIYRRLEEKFGLPQDNILLLATHTHSAPATAADNFKGPRVSEDFLGQVEEAAVLGVATSRDAMAAADLIAYQASNAPAINRRVVLPTYLRLLPGHGNRRVANRPNRSVQSDKSLTALKVEFADKSQLWLVNLAMHAAIHRGHAYSSDYPGYLAAAFSNLSDTMIRDVVYLPGWAGDQVADLTKKTPFRPTPNGILDLLIGGEMFDRESGLAGVKEIARQIAVSLFDQRAQETAVAIDGSISATTSSGALSLSDDTTKTVYSKGISIGPLSILAVNGEPFASFRSRAIQEEPAGPTMTVGYMDGPFGYLPDEQGLEEGGYEPDRSIALFDLSARFDKRAPRQFVDMLTDLQSRLKGAGRTGGTAK